MKTKFLGEWKDMTDVVRDWNGLEHGQLAGYRVLVACYDQGDYDGWAFILARRNRKFFCSEASHCSCYGLEWSGWEETSKEALRRREFYSHDDLKSAVLDVIGKTGVVS